MATDGSTVTTSDRWLVIERSFDAPRPVVFDAWTKAGHLVNWFGPKDFTLPSCTLDFRVGGSYRFCMRSPDGEDYWVWGEYREIDPPERIVMTWNREDMAGKVWSRTVAEFTFVEIGNRTSFTLRQGMFETEPFCEDHGFGWGQALDRLGEYVSAY